MPGPLLMLEYIVLECEEFALGSQANLNDECYGDVTTVERCSTVRTLAPNGTRAVPLGVGYPPLLSSVYASVYASLCPSR